MVYQKLVANLTEIGTYAFEFIQEQKINGEVFYDLTEENLQDDLDISLNRIRKQVLNFIEFQKTLPTTK